MDKLVLIVLIIIYGVWWLHHEEKPPLPANDPWTLIHKPEKPPPKAPPKPPPEPRWLEIYSPIVICTLLILSIFVSSYSKEASTIFIFVITMITIFLRPRGITEVYPSVVGAVIIIITRTVTYENIIDITGKISGASLTIISTIVMAVILESFGFFHWLAARLIEVSKGSGYRLYWYIQLLCFFMTLLFNNDGSILITTPILVLVLKNLKIKPHEQIPYLISGALTATASSAPIGVSNITNLIALKIVHMSLYTHTSMMFVPCTLGLSFMSILMFFVLKKRLKINLSVQQFDLEEVFFTKIFQPVNGAHLWSTKNNRKSVMLKVLLFVFTIRCLIFVASYFNIPIEIVAVTGSLIMLLWRWYYLRTNPIDILKKTPWGILIFAFSMYVIIYGLNNIGLTEALVNICKPIVKISLLHASLVMGALISVLSNTFNNHPALMIGTITLTNMGLSSVTLKTIYLANIIGSDIGSLLLPIGTLASLIWMHLLKQNVIRVTWKDYLSVTVKVIPITVVFTLILLFYWVQAMFT